MRISDWSSDVCSSDLAEDYATALEGISKIIDRLAARGVVDKARVGMGGFSYGGDVAAWVGGKSDLLSAISVASSQTSPPWYWFSAPIEGRPSALKQRWGLGRPDETPRHLPQISPAPFTDPEARQSVVAGSGGSVSLCH